MAEDVVWLSSDTNIAEVDSEGNVIAKREGEATISAIAGVYRSKCKVLVTDRVANIDVIFNDGTSTVDIFNIQGICLKRNATKDVVGSLPPGLYIVNGQKVYISAK